jgi:hypothetical protein
MDGLCKMSSLMQQTYYSIPREIRACQIAVEFLKDGRFDRIERKLYVLDTAPDIDAVVVLDSHLMPSELSAAGNLYGKHSHQWLAIRLAMKLTDWRNTEYDSYGWRWTADDYRNSDNPFLKWLSRTSTGCETVDFKCSSRTKTVRKTKYHLLYV